MVRKMAEGKNVVNDGIGSFGSMGRVRVRGSSYCND